MSRTDYLHLNDHKIFQNVRETLPQGINKAKSVLAIRDDMLYTWNFQDNCVLALNVKAVRSRNGDNVKHQTLLPMSAPYFTPNNLIVNESNTLLAVYGPNGVLVYELPERSPPHGCFSNNKEIIYCRTHSLHERTLAFSTKIEVRQVRFHPGSEDDNHLLFLTNDNIIRVYKIVASAAISAGVYRVGQQPGANMPSSQISMIEVLGETAVDFDFGPPELCEKQVSKTTPDNTRSINLYSANISLQKSGSKLKIEETSPVKKDNNKVSSITWPIYFLYGDGKIYTMTINLNEKIQPLLKGPHQLSPKPKGVEFCSIICIPSTPPIVAIANQKGNIYHLLVLPNEIDKTDVSIEERNQDKILIIIESVELELGLNTTHISSEYSCPIYLHKNSTKLGNYFATHETGVHSISLSCIEALHKFVKSENDDMVLPEILEELSNIEYLICTKTTTIEQINPVIGFDLYFDPLSVVVLLGNGQLVSLVILTMKLPAEDYLPKDGNEDMNSPLKKLLSNPFDAQIQRILRQASSQPILKMSGAGDKSQQECFELLQRASQVFRKEHFKQYERAREEIEKRVKALRMLKDFQKKEIERMTSEKQSLQETAENLAEKYEDMKDKQEELTKRCEKLLILISKMHSEPSNAEKKYHENLKEYQEKLGKYSTAINKLKNKMKYQEVQMQNWYNHNKKSDGLGSEQSAAIKTNLQDATNKISAMVKEVNGFKQQLNLP